MGRRRWERNVGWGGEGGGGWGSPIDMKLPQGEGGGGVQREEIVRRASGRLCRTIQGGRQQGTIAGARGEALLRGGGAVEHASAVIGARLGTQEGSAGGIEQVKGGIIGIWPQAKLGIIGEVGIGK